jgi:hypothetical protein
MPWKCPRRVFVQRGEARRKRAMEQAMRSMILPLLIALFSLASTDIAEAAGLRKVYYDKNGIRLIVEVEINSPQKNTYHLRVFVENNTNKGVDVVGYVDYMFTGPSGAVKKTLSLNRYVKPKSTTAWLPGSFKDLKVLGANLTKVTFRS